MQIALQNRTQWNPEKGATNLTTWKKWLVILDSQEHNKTLWYIVSMIAQGVLFLPVPAALIYYFNAPVLILPITLALFFANIIAGMGGASVRFLVLLFLASAIIHIAMITVFIL